jgi:hypothetical protein
VSTNAKWSMVAFRKKSVILKYSRVHSRQIEWALMREIIGIIWSSESTAECQYAKSELKENINNIKKFLKISSFGLTFQPAACKCFL